MLNKFREKLKTNTKQKLTALIFAVIIFSMTPGMIWNYYDTGSEFLISYRANTTPDMTFRQRVKGITTSAEAAASAGVLYRARLIEFYGFSQLAMNRKIVIDPNYGALYKTPYGQIAYAVEEKYIELHLDRMYGLVNSLVSANVPFLYVQAPFKLPDANSQLPLNVRDYSNQNADEFVKKLTGANVSCFDLRPLLRGSGMTQNELFFDTDHHWRIETAFLSAGLIAEKMNADYGFEIDMSYFDASNYNFETFSDFFIGSLGRRAGRIYGGIDDFTLIAPNFKTDLSFGENGGALLRGAFEDVILKKEFIDENAPKDTNRYAVYRRDEAEAVFVNHLVDNGRVLIIKDSFGTPVYSFLALGVHEMRAVDVRLFEGSLIEYVKSYSPDIVLMLYNADCFNDQMFDFN